MRVFVTGATGFIGEAVVHELLDAGHQVLGLARSEEAAEKLAQWGAKAHQGNLTDLESLKAGAKACDGVIHLAFIHDFSTYQQNAQIDREALKAMAEALEGTGKPLISTSGTAVAEGNGVATEEDGPESGGAGSIRAVSEEVLEAAKRGVRAMTVRLSPSVHGEGDHGFIPSVINFALTNGFAAYTADGNNRWPAVHRKDAAVLFRLALEKGEAGKRYHGVAEEGITFKEIADTIGASLNIPVRSISQDETAGYYQWLAKFATMDNPTSSAFTRQSLGWEPTGPGLLEDMRLNGYFNSNS